MSAIPFMRNLVASATHLVLHSTPLSYMPKLLATKTSERGRNKQRNSDFKIAHIEVLRKSWRTKSDKECIGRNLILTTAPHDPVNIRNSLVLQFILDFCLRNSFQISTPDNSLGRVEGPVCRYFDASVDKKGYFSYLIDCFFELHLTSHVPALVLLMSAGRPPRPSKPFF